MKTHDHRLSIQLDQLLEVLGDSPTLHHLELEGLYFEHEDEEFYDDDEVPDSKKSILQLPHLQFLSLKQCSSGAFLPIINPPATTNVVLAVNDPFFLGGDDFHSDPPSILYVLPPNFEELSFIGKFETLDFEIRDSCITLRASQPSGQYLLIEQVPDPDAPENTIEEMVLPSAISFANGILGPVTTLRASNLLSESKRDVLRDAGRYDVDRWLITMSGLERLEIFYFPLNFLECFAGGEGKQLSPLAVKEVTLIVYPNECGDFKELKAWVKARAEAQLPFEKLDSIVPHPGLHRLTKNSSAPCAPR